VNLHNCSVSEFKEFFNVKEAHYHYSCKCWTIDLGEKNNPTFSEFIKHASAPYSKELDWRPNWTSLKLKKCIKKYKVGEFINDRYKIKEMHLDKGGIILTDTRYKNQEVYYYFEDIDEKPSIYDTNYRNTYGYGEYWD